MLEESKKFALRGRRARHGLGDHHRRSVAPYATLEAAGEAGAVTVDYDVFANAVISFLIVAFTEIRDLLEAQA